MKNRDWYENVDAEIDPKRDLDESCFIQIVRDRNLSLLRDEDDLTTDEEFEENLASIQADLDYILAEQAQRA